MTSPQATDLFNRQWSTYRTMVEHNLMEHRPVAEAVGRELAAWLAARPMAAPAPELVDLGCGDLALLAPLLRSLPLGAYTGLDLAPVVLPLAQQALGSVPYPTRWLEGDLLGWACGSEQTDLLHSGFAIHHLCDEDKARFLQQARQRIRPGGLFLWVDVFRDAGESREVYLERYSQRIERHWQVLAPEERRRTIEHVSGFDFPADREEIRGVAEAAGWQWRWAWQGEHRAEAMAVLTPVG